MNAVADAGGPSEAPLPPVELIGRVGVGTGVQPDPDDELWYDLTGAGAKQELLRLLPRGWSFVDKRVLDFGCGSGRALRHFVDEASRQTAEFCGCDIDQASIRWLDAELSPPFRVFRNGELPPLDQENDSFDLIYAVSVFTHLTDNWSAWLAELHRLLKDDGLLIATFHGEGFWNMGVAGRAGIPFDERLIGMHVEHYGDRFSDSWGPAVYLSEWWIREHWGRAFEILTFEPYGFLVGDNRATVDGQGRIVMRPKPGRALPAELEEVRAGDARELGALRHSQELLQQEVAGLSAQLGNVRARFRSVTESRSWRLTAPLRTMAMRFRGGVRSQR